MRVGQATALGADAAPLPDQESAAEQVGARPPCGNSAIRSALGGYGRASCLGEQRPLDRRWPGTGHVFAFGHDVPKQMWLIWLFAGDGILELLSHLIVAMLDSMHVETPIRAGGTPGEFRPPLPRQSPGEGADFPADAWNSRSRPEKDTARVSDGHGTDREERLLRLVDILRTEQVRGSIVANTEDDKTRLHRWRGPCVLAVVIVLMGAAVLLQASRQAHVYSDVQSDLPTEPAHLSLPDLSAKVVQPQPRGGTGDVGISPDRPADLALIPLLPEALPQGNSHRSQPLLTEHRVTDSADITEATTPPDTAIAEREPIDLHALRHEAVSLAKPPLAG